MKVMTLINASRRHAAVMRRRILVWEDEPERGDVPGWVLITVMTAGLVAALWLVAEPLLSGMFTSAVSGVAGP
jgi:hypothetical protein